MNKFQLKLYKLATSSVVFFTCLNVVASDADIDKRPHFTGFSMFAGPAAIYVNPSSAAFQSTRSGVTSVGNFLTTTPLTPSTYWSGAAKFGIEYSTNLKGFFLGLNVNYLTGANWRQGFTTPLTNVNNTIQQSFAKFILNADYLITTLIKLGYTFNLSLPSLIYAEAGVGGGDFTPEDYGNFNLFVHSVNPRWLAGWVAGAGIETLLTNRLSIGADYTYSQYQKTETHAQVSTLTSNATGWFSAVPEIQTITLYLKYTFTS